jgi:hypothetical protein
VRRLKPPAWIAGIALVLWVMIGHGFANYDALYSLVWGQQLARGEVPQYDLPIAPTPHPLGTLVGLALSPLGPGGSEGGLVAIGFLAVGALGYLVYRLGAEWFGPAAGLLAATVILTREPVLSYGIRAYVDISYIALVLLAVLVETRRPRAGAPVLVVLAVAGLLRPEAWLFSGAYVPWLAWRRGPGPRRELPELLPLAALAVSAPVLWAASDLLVTGNPLWSLTKTRHTAETLRRVTGLSNVPATMPRRIGEVLREPVLFGAGVGALAALAWLRHRAWLAAAVGIVAVLAFCVLAAAGLPIVTRYVLLPSAILATFCGAGAFGWMLVAHGERHRPWWLGLGVVVLIGLAAFIPAQAHRLSRTFDALGRQQRIETDLVSLVDKRAIGLRCPPVVVPNHRPVPLLALRLHVRPGRIVDAQVTQPPRGTYVQPASMAVAQLYILDKHDPHPLTARVPPGFRQTAANGSWRVFERCG